MITIKSSGIVVFQGTKEEGISFLKKNGLTYRGNDIPLLVLGHLATKIGYEVYCN